MRRRQCRITRPVLHDRDGELRAGLAVKADGRPDLAMYDKNGKIRVMVGVHSDDLPNVVLIDSDGNPVYEVP